MNSLRLSDPFFSNSMESAVRRFFPPSLLDGDRRSAHMSVDVTERDGHYDLRADLPGINKNDISVRIDGNTVQIDVHPSSAKEQKPADEKVLCNERYKGTLTRSFSLADDIDDAQVKASYADGVLHLDLPKKPSAASRKIAIQ